MLIALLLTSCNSKPSPSQQVDDVTKLPSSFPIIERLKLVEYGTGAQEIFHYRRGFLSKSGSSRTYYDAETRTQKSFPPFDAQAQADLAALEDAIAKTGVSITRISGLKYDSKGKIAIAEFQLRSNFAPLRYVFSPNYKTLP
ncbi:MAG: hypothetical protein HC770_13680, partial [Pseudanabaena sp. CRU_2_10]|nr:hypothetical protein [Pseudanabaena sp. CRU_2_10]